MLTILYSEASAWTKEQLEGNTSDEGLRVENQNFPLVPLGSFNIPACILDQLPSETSSQAQRQSGIHHTISNSGLTP